ncbi:STAS domain-containing protein [Notoacmeibacter ruber]|uniref:STAS domain-containing protein n=1 Tax=Notoacmeibacter ruber TaxID=2670375 RepID=A0A3L7JDE4_9HYPH|nr:STAS domain-containing protein [Notoacmeibacter ruber]RLQ88808.1 STAS domain-containing protein [Notoacmeibacter ruber]
MQNSIDDFMPLTEEPKSVEISADFTEPFIEDDGSRLMLEGAPALEMEELPAFADAPAEASIDELADLAPIASVDADELPDLASFEAAEAESTESSLDVFPNLESDATDIADMTVEAGASDNGEGIILPEVLDLDQAENLRATLLERIGTNLVIDASEVTRIDTPCIEVAISASKQWFEDGFTLEWSNPSEPFITSLDRLGLSTDFLRNEGVH